MLTSLCMNLKYLTSLLGNRCDIYVILFILQYNTLFVWIVMYYHIYLFHLRQYTIYSIIITSSSYTFYYTLDLLYHIHSGIIEGLWYSYILICYEIIFHMKIVLNGYCLANYDSALLIQSYCLFLNWGALSNRWCQFGKERRTKLLFAFLLYISEE